jgi:hypothetical protein
MKNALIFLSCALLCSGLYAQSAGDYRSIATGNWNVITNWERFDGATWQPATSAPASSDGVITVANPFVITSLATVTADQVVVEAGATLTISAAFTVANGTGTDLSVDGTVNVGANLAGPGTTSVNGLLAWTAGVLSTPVTVAAAGNVTISAGAKTLNTTLVNNGTIGHLPGAAVSGTGSITINGTYNWSGGSIAASSVIASGATLNASGTGTKTINGSGTVTNNGTINWSAGSLSLANGTLNNNGSIDMTFDGAMSSGGGTNAFNNTGSFTKSAGTGSSGIGVPTNNTGSINVNSGTLSTTGVTQLNAGTVLTGTGTLSIDGTFNVNTTINAPASLTIRKVSGTTAGSWVFNVLGAMNWNGGILASTFHIASGAVLTLSSATAKALNSNLTNDGTINWSSAAVDFNNGTLLNNGTMNLSIDGSLNNTSGSNLLNNTGNFNKIGGAGNTTIAIPSLNSGTINVNSGTLVNSSSSFINTGTINIAAARTFSNTGTLMLQPGTLFTGSGNLSFSGFAQLTTNVSLPSTITLNVLTGSSSLGGGVMTVNGTMNWTAGTIGSPYLISATATLNASGTAKTLSNTLTNNGAVIWTAGNIDFNNGTLTNNGTIDQGFNGTLEHVSGTNLFTNTGTYSKTAGAGISSVNIPSDNTGTINGAGTIQFTSTFNDNGIIAPGRPMGVLNVTSTVSPLLTGSSNLQIEMLNGTGAGTGHDQLVHSGNLVLGGTLTVTETGVMPAGDYTILQLSSGTISGSFATVNVPVSYLVFVNASNVVIRKSILPLNWISFTGTKASNSILLNWKTENERMTKEFEVERSADGSHYVNVGLVKAKGLNEVKTYSFEDLLYHSGVNYYRLKQIDLNGTFEYSKTIVVKADEPANGTIRMFPNPSKGEVTIIVPDEWLTADVMISNLSGQVVEQYKNINQRSLQVQLPQGSYLVMFRKSDKSVMAQLRVN